MGQAKRSTYARRSPDRRRLHLREIRFPVHQPRTCKCRRHGKPRKLISRIRPPIRILET